MSKSTGTKSRREAEAICDQRRAAIADEVAHPRKAEGTFRAAADAYLNAGGEGRFLELLIVYFGDTQVADMGQKQVEECAYKLFSKLAPSSVNRQVYTPISAVLTHAAWSGLCSKPLLKRPKQPQGRVRWISYEDADHLVACCAPHLAPIVTFLFATGARVGEALDLEWDKVDLDRKHVVFRKSTEDGERRAVLLPHKAYAALKALPGREGYVFRTDEGLPYAKKFNAGGQFKSAFRSACKRAGITHFHPHDCRHTWATWYYKRKPSLGDLMKLGGWKTVSMVMRYAHVNLDDLSEDVEALWRSEEK